MRAQHLDEGGRRVGTVRVDEQQIRVDPIRVRQQVPHPDPFGHPRSHQAELGQVRHDTLVQIQDTALDLL